MAGTNLPCQLVLLVDQRHFTNQLIIRVRKFAHTIALDQIFSDLK